MTHKESLTPDTLFSSTDFGFAQVVTSRQGKFVHCAGQTAWDKDMRIVGEGDLGRQLEQAFKNVRLALAAGGATPDDVVRITIYVVGYQPQQIETIGQAMNSFFDKDKQPASTVVGVQSLALPEFLVEIEVTAVIDE
jgi:enamine deaminase RidA (YjgF/YER057c/UK114 family)